MLSVAIFLAVCGLLAFVCAALLMAIGMLRPPRMTDGRAAWLLKRLSPADLGMHYESVFFSVPRGRRGGRLRLAAWWIPARGAGDSCAVLLHGYGDAKVGAIAWAPMLHEKGYNVLALDMRAHGQSDGRFVTAGVRERHDVSAVIDQLRLARPACTRHVILFGISYGGAVAAATAALRNDIAGVVLDCPVLDFASAAAAHCDLHGLPGRLIQRTAKRLASALAGEDLGSLRTAEVLPVLQCPLMLVDCGRDVFVAPHEREHLRRALDLRRQRGLPTISWEPADALHLEAIVRYGDEYRRRLEEFSGLCAAHPASSSSTAPRIYSASCSRTDP